MVEGFENVGGIFVRKSIAVTNSTNGIAPGQKQYDLVEGFVNAARALFRKSSNVLWHQNKDAFRMLRTFLCLKPDSCPSMI